MKNKVIESQAQLHEELEYFKECIRYHEDMVEFVQYKVDVILAKLEEYKNG